MMAAPDRSLRYYTRRPFTYAGQTLSRGQVFRLVGAKNDEPLVRLEYCRPLAKSTDIYRCDECGGEFIGMNERAGHAKEQHRTRFATPYDEDAHTDRQEALLEQVAPLNLENSLASRKG